MVLTELFTNIANAIRSKDGTSGLINATDFPDRITNIPNDGSDTLTERLRLTIKNYSMPKDVTELPPYIFYGCSNLKNLDLSNIIKVNSHSLYNIGDKEINLPKCTTFTTQSGDTSLIDVKSCEKFIAPKLNRIPNLTGYMGGQYKGILNEIDLRSATTASTNSLMALPLKNLYLPKIKGNITGLCKCCGNLENVLYNANLTTQMFCRTYTASTTIGGNFTTLVIPNNEPVILSNINAIAGTQISGGNGYIYVPRNTIETYKSMTNWSVVSEYAIDGTFKAIEDNLELIESVFPYFKEDFLEFYKDEVVE